MKMARLKEELQKRFDVCVARHDAAEQQMLHVRPEDQDERDAMVREIAHWNAKAMAYMDVANLVVLV